MSKKKFGGYNDTPSSRLKKPKVLAPVEFEFDRYTRGFWKDVAIHDSYAVAIDDTNKLYTWGTNNKGNLGLELNYSDKDEASWIQVSSGINGGMAIRADGTLWSWGRNSEGQLGQNNVINRSSPVQIGSFAWKKVAYSQHHALAIREDGYLFAWGWNNLGQLGDNTILNKSSPVQISGEKWLDVKAGHQHTLALRSDYSVWTWGGNENGQLGQSNRTHRSSPVQVSFTTGSSWISINTSAYTNHIIKSDSTLWGWGLGTSGQLGNNTAISRSSIVQVGSALGLSWRSVTSGDRHHIATATNGNLYAWGLNSSGQLATGNTTSLSFPEQILAGKSWKNVKGSGLTTFLVDTNDDLYAVGRNLLGEIPHEVIPDGTAGPINKSSPVLIGSGFDLSVSEPGRSTIAMIKSSDYTIWSWGSNIDGGLGINSIAAHRSSPTQIKYINNSASYPKRILVNNDFKEVTAGQNHALAINNNGKLFGWGSRQGVDSLTTAISWKKVAVGSSSRFSMALRSDGKLYAWGQNTNGELGLNDLVHRSSPTQIPGNTIWTNVVTGSNYTLATDDEGILWNWGVGTSGQIYNASGNEFTLVTKSYAGQVRSYPHSWSKVASGQLHTAAVRSDNTLWAWGINTHGQLGNNTILSQSSPVQIGSNDWNDVACGASHTVARKTNNSVWAWGFNTQGQLGQGNIIHRSSPVQIGAVLANAIGTTGFATYYTNASNALFSVGSNASGELGDNTVISRSSPVSVTTNVSRIYGANITAHIIRTNGTLWGMGNNGNGQIGYFPPAFLGSVIQRSYPASVGVGSGETVSWIKIASSSSASHSLGIKSNGTLWAWGLNSSGQLGQGNIIHRSSPVQIGALSTWIDVATGSAHSLARNSSKQLFTWGLNNIGQLGLGDVVSRSSPAQVTAPSLSWDQISAGLSSTVARNGTNIYTWGLGTSGQLGHNDAISKSSPTLIGSGYNNIAAGDNHMLATNTSNKLFGWGINTTGELGAVGLGAIISKSSPVQVMSTALGWESAEGGNAFTLAREKTTNNLYAWGIGTSGQLGDNSLISKSSPVQVALPLGVNDYAASASTGYAIDTNGRLYAWGINSNGQIGDGTVVTISSPVQIGSSSWNSVSAAPNGSHVLAIRVDGTLWAWGRNANGQLGQGNIIHRSSPVQIGAESNWNFITAGGAFSIARKNDGTIYAWGRNNIGQLATLDIIDRSSPTQILSGSDYDVAQIFAADSHVATLKTDGTIWSWGSNSSGRLGNGTSVSASSPVQVLGSQSWVALNVGQASTYAINDDGLLHGWGIASSGELGRGNTTASASPVLIRTSNRSILKQDSWLSIGRGGVGNASAISNTNPSVMYAWGIGTSGQLGWAGDGTVINQSSPVQIASDRNFSFINAGTTSSYAITNEADPLGAGKLFAWGLNTSGQLGLPNENAGSTTQFSYPIRVGINEERDDTYISFGEGAAGHHTLAIRSDGALFAWGLNRDGQCGQDTVSPTFITYSSPVQIGTPGRPADSWTQVAGGYLHTMAINARDSSLWAMGANARGQLGDSSTTRRPFPVKIGNESWSQVACGRSWTVAIRTDGGLYAWGWNNLGQLGIGNVVDRNSPVQIGNDSWLQVSAGNSHTAALRADGTIWAWGSGANGRLGDNTSVSKSSPVQVGLGYSWNMISAGTVHTAAIREDGLLFVWGSGTTIGNGFAVTKSSPVQIGFESWTYVHAGDTTVHAIKQDGTLWAWGSGSSGRLGNGDVSLLSQSSPVQVGRKYLSDPRELLDKDDMISQSWTKVGGNEGTVWATRADGSLWIWGRSSEGQIANQYTSTMENRSSPVQVGRDNWISVKGGSVYASGIRSDGVIYSWGSNSNGRLGAGNLISSNSPTQVRNIQYPGDYMSNNTKSFTQLGGGQNHTHGITTTGQLYAWGLNSSGQLGVPGEGSTQSASSPVQIGISSWTQVAHGVSHTVGLRADGTIWAWGLGTSGELGDNTILSKSSPVQIGNTSAWLGVGAIRNSGFATQTNKMYAWGLGTTAQLAQGERAFIPPETANANRSSPVLISTFTTGNVPWSNLADSRISSIATHVAAIDSEGSLFTWGLGTSGQLGVATDMILLSRSSPVQVQSYQRYNSDGTPSRRSWSFIDAGGFHSVGITTDGLLFGWGSGPRGQLGQLYSQLVPATAGTTTGVVVNVSSPVQIGSQTENFNIFLSDPSDANTQFLTSDPQNLSWKAVAAGQSHTTGINANGQLFAFGHNPNGQLGSGNLVHRSSPVQVGQDSWKLVASKLFHVLGIKENGTLWAWGLNSSGQLGQGNRTHRNSPTQIGSSNNWIDVVTGLSNSGAINSDNYLYTWGLGTSGQLGHSNAISRSSPVQVGLLQWKNIDYANNEYGFGVSMGNAFTLGIRKGGPRDQLFAWGVNTDFGQLGISPFDKTNKSSPTQVGLREMGTIVMNAETDTTYEGLDVYFPRQIGDLNYNTVSAGDDFTLAVASDKLYTWGINSIGQLGDSSTVEPEYFSPIQIGTQDWKSVDAGESYSVAIKK